jgi:hypothetical protein
LPGWSRIEVEAAVADYLVMLKDELKRRAYNKTDHRRLLSRILENRSEGSIERKHQNISAILIELGYPWINGYKPLGNYQGLLAEVVVDSVTSDRELATIVEEAVQAPAAAPEVNRILDRLVDPPPQTEYRYPPVKDEYHIPGQRRNRVNYFELEAQNSSLGLAGEVFIVDFEVTRLRGLGKDTLADRVEHTAAIEGDGAGFDIRSFEADGTDRFVEVKTTAYGKQTPFFISRNEIAVSEFHGSRYHLYRIFKFREHPQFYSLTGSVVQHCSLEAVQFSARPRLIPRTRAAYGSSS